MATNEATDNKIAVVTGGSSGIGRHTAIRIAERGAGVLLTYNTNPERAGETVATIEDRGGTAAALQLDVGNSEMFDAFAQRVAAEINERWQRTSFDYLVNNAGFGGMAMFADTSEELYDAFHRVILKGPFFLTQKLLPLLADGGRIVNLSTGLTRFSLPGHSAYASAKGAVDVLTRYMAAELGPRGIAVNAVAPGATDTDFEGGFLRSPEARGHIASKVALGRVGAPEDIGGAIASLLSGPNHWITGQRIEASGGQSL